jgi:hypothetical protein
LDAPERPECAGRNLQDVRRDDSGQTVRHRGRLAQSLGRFKSTNPKAKQLDAKEMFDYSYLGEIDKSGFIDALYK